MPRSNLSPAERFWAKVDKTETCWLWRGFRNRKGYGYFAIGRAVFLSHQLAYGLEVGPIPEGLQIDHLCRNPSCVNPNHLEPVTARENCLRTTMLITHCPHGHPYDGANTYVSSEGHRFCRQCSKDRRALAALAAVPK